MKIIFLDYDEKSYSYAFFKGSLVEALREMRILEMAGHKDVHFETTDLDRINISKSIIIDSDKIRHYYHLRNHGDKIVITNK